MPELPEVESVLRALSCHNPSFFGQRVREVMIMRSSVVDGPVERFAEELTGAVFMKFYGTASICSLDLPRAVLQAAVGWRCICV